MELTDNLAVKQIIGGLMKNTLLFLEYVDIQPEDFEVKLPRICFGAIKNLYDLGAKKLTTIEVENEIIKVDGSSKLEFQNNGGLEFLKVCYEIAEVDNFKIYYERFKKLSLLRTLKAANYDISYYYKETKDLLPFEEVELQERFDNASLEDILNKIESNYNKIRENFLIGEHKNGQAAEGIEELLEDLKQCPDNGPLLEGDIFNYVCRGARAGKFYLRSGASNAGKTRLAVFDACRLAYPIRYSIDKGTFIKEMDYDFKPVEPRKVLFIVTEMDREELQTIMLAYLSGVNEEHILRNRYDLGEEDRVLFAAKIMKKYRDYFLIEEISEPNLLNVESTIKKYVTIDNVKYIAYDYIHSTASLLSQLGQAGREETALMIMSNQLKQIAKDYNVFIFSSTQVNATGMADDGEFKNMMSLRGAKSIADKIDMGTIITKITPNIWNSLTGTFKQAVREGIIDSRYLDSDDNKPTYILDVYKNRRGRLKDVRIWTKIDLGTGYRKDLFITNMANYPIDISIDNLFTTNTEMLGNWRELMKEGQF